MITINTILYTNQTQKPKKRVYKSLKINYIFTHKFSSLAYSFSKKTNYIFYSKPYVISKRFYPGNSSKSPSTLKPQNLKNSDSSSNPTPISPEEINPFIPSITNIIPLDYVSSYSTQPVTPITSPQATFAGPSILDLKNESQSHAQTTINSAKAHQGIQEKVNEPSIQPKTSCTTISNELKEMFSQTSVHSTEKKEEEFKAISGVNILSKNAQSGLVTGININTNNAEISQPQTTIIIDSIAPFDSYLIDKDVLAEINKQQGFTKPDHNVSVDKIITNKSVLNPEEIPLKPVVSTSIPTPVPVICSNITYIYNSGKSFTTKINETTIVENLTDNDLILELQKRELIKTDNGNTAVVVKLEDDSNFLLGSTKHKIKLSPLGQAYSSQVMLPQEVQLHEMPLTLKENDAYEFIITLSPKISSELFIETGHQKHLLIVHNKNDNEYYAIGYLTSKKTGKLLHNEQLKVFQQKIDNINFTVQNPKTQNYVPFEFAKKINQEDVKRVFKDTQYMQSISALSRKQLCDDYKELFNKGYVLFNKDGITKEICLRMCLEHDKIFTNNGKHPLSLDQIKQNEDNSIKQKDNLNKNLKNKIASFND